MSSLIRDRQDEILGGLLETLLVFEGLGQGNMEMLVFILAP